MRGGDAGLTYRFEQQHAVDMIGFVIEAKFPGVVEEVEMPELADPDRSGNQDIGDFFLCT